VASHWSQERTPPSTENLRYGDAYEIDHRSQQDAQDENPENAVGQRGRLSLFLPGGRRGRLLAALSWQRPSLCPPSEFARSSQGS